MGKQQRITVRVQRFKDRKNLMLQWYDPVTGKRCSRSSGTADEQVAEQSRADLEYELNHGLYSDPSDLSWPSFRDLFEREYCSGLRRRSAEKFSTVFDVLESEMKLNRLSQIDERFLSKFVVKLRNRKRPQSQAKKRKGEPPRVGLKPITIRNYLVNIKTALAWASDQGFIIKPPKFPKVKVPKKKPEPIPAETFERLLQAERNQLWRVYMCFAWWAGLRLSEAYALVWERSDTLPWIDTDQDRIVLPAEFVKSDQDQWLPLHPQLKEMLRTIPRTHKKMFPFVNRQGIPLTRVGVTNHVLMVAKRAGVRLSMHKLRKGFGCRVAALLGKGNAPILHRLMRHASMQITMDYYANVDDALSDALSDLS